jgi:hypothetical protein
VYLRPYVIIFAAYAVQVVATQWPGMRRASAGV